MKNTGSRNMNLENSTISVIEMAKLLKISKDNAYFLAHSEGFFPAIFIRRTIRISMPAFRRWLEEGNFKATDL